MRVSTQREHSLTNLLGHDPTSDPGIALRQWVHFQGVENILDLLSWEEDELKAIPAQQIFTLVLMTKEERQNRSKLIYVQ